MKWTVIMKVKDYLRNWSNQELSVKYKDVNINVKIKDLNCLIVLEGQNQSYIKEVFKIMWELLALYDGYFYEPQEFYVDGNRTDIKELFTLGMYRTDKLWYGSELIGRAERELSENILKQYDEFRNTGIANKKMTKSVVNAFYYIKSNDYGKININHRLSLLLNVVDGFVINTFKDTNNVKSSLDRFFKKTVDNNKLQKGISLLGINPEKYKNLLTGERNTFDHYKYLDNSLAAIVYNTDEEIMDYATWYFVYVIELIIRINILKESGVTLKQEYVDYALESINDWLIYENKLDVKCTTAHYKMRQELRELGIEMR